MLFLLLKAFGSSGKLDGGLDSSCSITPSTQEKWLAAQNTCMCHVDRHTNSKQLDISRVHASTAYLPIYIPMYLRTETGNRSRDSRKPED